MMTSLFFPDMLQIDKDPYFLNGFLLWNLVFGAYFVGNYYLLTGCKGRTRKYKPKVFHTARACEGCLENQGLVFPGTARAPS